MPAYDQTLRAEKAAKQQAGLTSGSSVVPIRPDVRLGEMAKSSKAVPAPAYRWFRLYNEVLDDPKVQRLDGETFRRWINILCLASKNAGMLPCLADLAFALRITEETAHYLVTSLYDRKLLDKVEAPDAAMSYMPHNWNGRQYKSDADPTAPDRSKRYRDRKRGVTAASRVTSRAPEQIQSRTDTDTDTDVEAANDFVGVRKEEDFSQAEKPNPMAAKESKAASPKFRTPPSMPGPAISHGIATANPGIPWDHEFSRIYSEDQAAKKLDRLAERFMSMSPEELWCHLRGAAILQGQLTDWAAHRFKELRGQYPDRAWNDQPAAKEVDEAVFDWVGLYRKTYAKSQRNKEKPLPRFKEFKV